MHCLSMGTLKVVPLSLFVFLVAGVENLFVCNWPIGSAHRRSHPLPNTENNNSLAAVQHSAATCPFIVHQISVSHWFKNIITPKSSIRCIFFVDSFETSLVHLLRAHHCRRMAACRLQSDRYFHRWLYHSQQRFAITTTSSITHVAPSIRCAHHRLPMRHVAFDQNVPTRPDIRRIPIGCICQQHRLYSHYG